jgi:carbamoyl-phosphate synthase large subunit
LLRACGYALREAGYETIMVNCNPETVSTDYDTSDRLYFEPLTEEDVVELIKAEQENGKVKGVIVQLGGQTPLKLAHPLVEKREFPFWAPIPDAIDLAEDRERFQKLIKKLKLKQPPNGLARRAKEAEEMPRRSASARHPPVLCSGRPGHADRSQQWRAEAIYQNGGESFGRQPGAARPLPESAIEVDVDALCGRRRMFMSPASWSISRKPAFTQGDSACVLPPHSLPAETVKEIEKQTINWPRR